MSFRNELIAIVGYVSFGLILFLFSAEARSLGATRALVSNFVFVSQLRGPGAQPSLECEYSLC